MAHIGTIFPSSLPRISKFDGSWFRFREVQSGSVSSCVQETF